MVIKPIDIQLREERIKDYQEIIHDHLKSIALMNQVRELFPDDWEIDEYARLNIFLMKQNIEDLMEQIQNDQKAISEYRKRKAA